MAINLPGTLLYKAMKARKELAQILAQKFSSRRQKKQDYKDLLGSFMGEKAGLTDEQIADSVLEAVTEEQECILKSMVESGEDKGLNWEDANNFKGYSGDS